MHCTFFRRFLFTCILLHLGLAKSAQKTILKGIVHTEDNKGAGGLLVRSDEKRETRTDSLGHFVFANVANGNHTVSLSGWGISPQMRQIQLPSDSSDLLFIINYSYSQLTDVIVTGGKNNYNSKYSDFVAKMPLHNMENPQVYTTITSAQMQDQLIVDYRDAFRNAAGVNSLEQVSNGRTSAFIRGFRTGNFLRNGMATTQLSLTEVANLDKIEVIKGPSGTLFGSSFISYVGAVNRVTKTPNATPSSSITYVGGSYGLSRMSFDVNTP